MSQKSRGSRREFIRNSSLLVAGGAVVASQLNIARAAHAYGSDVVKVGLVGCGDRGTGAAAHAMNTEGPVKLHAVADVFANKITAGLRGLGSEYKDKIDVPQERQFAGLDGYKQLLASDVDVVILATPPGFRPAHFEAAVQAGKHIFMEKPVAVDPAGVRRVIAANRIAKEKNLAVAVGLQRRHERRYQETIKRLQDGMIGDINFTRAYWNGAGVWVRSRKPNESEMEYQLRNWYYFNWLCGDHIVEQHIHNLDVVNWLKNGYPVDAQGQGGRQVRTGIDHGEIFDHHMIEFTYADGSKLLSQCRHIQGCWGSVSEHAHGSQGNCDIGGARILDTRGNEIWSYGQGGGDGHQQEHHDLFADLRKGNIPNEGDYAAYSSMTAILGRMASYSGKAITWNEALNSQLVISPIDTIRNLSDSPPTLPDKDGRYPIAMPGTTKVI